MRENRRSPAKNENVRLVVPLQINRKYNGLQLLDLYTDVFINLPVATIIDDAMIVLHGGLFKADGITIDHMQQIPRCLNVRRFDPATCRAHTVEQGHRLQFPHQILFWNA